MKLKGFHLAQKLRIQPVETSVETRELMTMAADEIDALICQRGRLLEVLKDLCDAIPMQTQAEDTPLGLWVVSSRNVIKEESKSHDDA